MTNCMICDRPIASTGMIIWCSQCQKDMGIAGLPMSEWPDNIRAIFRLYDRDRKREKSFSEHEIVFSDLDAASAAALGLEPETDREPHGFAEEGSHSGGTLTCLRCKHVFRDTKPTWPLDPIHWKAPECPKCGCGLLREGGNVRPSRKKARKTDSVAVR